MAIEVTEYRVFIASPGGLDQERLVFRQTLYDHNEIDARARRVVFFPVGWEDTLGGARRPQDLINRDLVSCDYFFLVLWDRWGSPPDNAEDTGYTSGCEEEFSVACECLNSTDSPMKEVAILFKGVDSRQLSDPGEQLKAVLAFRQSLEETKSHFFLTFDDTEAFHKIVRRYLAKWVRDHESPPPKGSGSPPGGGGQPLVSVADDPATFGFDIAGLAKEGRLTEAEAMLAREAIRQGDQEALYRYGRFLVSLGRLSQADALFRRLLDIKSPVKRKFSALAYANLGAIAQARGDLDAAEGMYRRALDLETSLENAQEAISVYDGLALILERRGDLSEADRMRAQAESFRTIIQPFRGPQTIQFYSCFISYTHTDSSFARRLHDQLQARGIRCWLDAHDLKPGDRILDVVDAAIRLHDKLLICCSKASLGSWWVKDEIRHAQERERHEDRSVIIPLNLDGHLFEWDDGLASDLTSRLAADFTGWEQDNAKFEAEFERVVEALRA